MAAISMKQTPRRNLLACLMAATLCCAHTDNESIAIPTCAPLGMGTPELTELKASGFAFDEASKRAPFLLAVTDCLDHPSPDIRDGIAYEAIASILRGGEVAEADLRALLVRLTGMMEAPADAAGFRRPFAALALAEVARTDRIKAWMTPDERRGLTKLGADYLTSIDDYRGFSEKEGWRHGVAHASDLLMQLSLNPALGEAEAQIILDAVFASVAPDGHFYVYGEPGRLARPVLFLAMRDDIGLIEWPVQFDRLTEWFATNADEVFTTQAGLARRHNVSAFVSEIFVAAETSGDTRLEGIGAAAKEALSAIP